MIQKEKKGTHGWKRGIRAYSSHIGRCHYCGLLCNTFWQPNWRSKPIFACSQKCANRLRDK